MSDDMPQTSGNLPPPPPPPPALKPSPAPRLKSPGNLPAPDCSKTAPVPPADCEPTVSNEPKPKMEDNSTSKVERKTPKKAHLTPKFMRKMGLFTKKKKKPKVPFTLQRILIFYFKFDFAN